MVVHNVVRSPVRAVVQSVFGEGESFHPFQLFRSGAQGAWYDPSDFSTLYQDANGTTPVTAVEQPVRLMLDRSKGLVLGSELVSNGDFSDGDTGWSVTGEDGTHIVTFANGTLRYQSDTTSPQLLVQQTGVLTVGKTYLLEINVSSWTSGSIKTDSFGGNTVLATSAGTTTLRVVASLTAFQITRNSTNVDLTIDYVSVRELPGNHALAPNDASRPVLRARYNLLTRTEDWSVSPWANVSGGTASLPTLTPNAGVAPNGTTTATRIQFALNGGTTTSDSVRRRQVITPPAGNNTFSFYVRSFDGVSTYTMLYEDADGFINSLTVTGDWQRVVKATNYVAVNTGLGLGIRGGQTPTNSDSADVLVWGAQLLTAADHAATGGAYQRVGAATDYDTGPPWRPYLAFDGSDDSMSTSSIDFSGTDEVTVFAGLTKLSDASLAVFAEISAASASNNGTFALFAPNPANLYTWRSRGTTSQDVNTGNPAYNAPDTSVLTGIGDISGDVSTLRIDGAQVGTNTSDQGTGNYGNYPLFIGRRNNASIPFNGRLYGLTVLGRTATAPELTAMESWIAGKTGVSL